MAEYRDIIKEICSNIHTGIIDFNEPRSKASMPSQASSEFITNKQQGDWAEDVIFRAINNNYDRIVAVKYGKSDDVVAGDDGFKEFFKQYQDELDSIGKRPDLLIFRKEDFNADLGNDISHLPTVDIENYVGKAIAGIEVRSSAFLIDKYNQEINRLIESNTDKVLKLTQELLSEYRDLLEDKCPGLIPILQTINSDSVSWINISNRTSWRSSERLQKMSALFSEIKKSLKVIQERNALCITPKVEDLKVVEKWVTRYNVPHYYVQVFFDRIYGISFENILRLISEPRLEGKKYFIEQDTKNQNKTTIKIPSQDGTCIAQKLSEPHHHSVRKELMRGRLLFYVKFQGGEAFIDKIQFDNLFGCNL